MGSVHRRSLFAYMSLLFVASTTQPSEQQHTTLVGTIGSDTVAVDRFIRSAEHIEGVLFVRRPQPHTMHYKAALAPEGRFSLMEIIWRDTKGVETRSARISFGVDSIRSELKDGSVRKFSAPPTLDAIPLPPQPYASHCYALLEHAAIVLLMSKQPVMTDIEWISAGATKVEKRRIRRSVGDTIAIDFMAGPVRVYADTERRAIWLTVGNKPAQVVVKRSDKDINIEKLVASFVRRDRL